MLTLLPPKQNKNKTKKCVLIQVNSEAKVKNFFSTSECAPWRTAVVCRGLQIVEAGLLSLSACTARVCGRLPSAAAGEKEKRVTPFRRPPRNHPACSSPKFLSPSCFGDRPCPSQPPSMKDKCHKTEDDLRNPPKHTDTRLPIFTAMLRTRAERGHNPSANE